MKDFNFKIPQNIQFGMGSLKKLPEILAENHSDNILLVSDRGLEKIGVVKKVQEIIEAAGLKCTSYLDVVPNPTVAVVNEATALYKECGATSIVALGGGVAGDLAGFLAGTILRGVPLVQMPTTLLAQVDSSIGGKTGVDFDSYKNMVGAFHMPRLVYMNISVLKTLPAEQFTAGMGEVIKHGLIRDAGYFSWLMENHEKILALEPEACRMMITGSCMIKREVVEIDPTEQNERATLNFGHTLGHAIEKLKCLTMLHGHCVALGALAAMEICRKRGLVSQADMDAYRKAMELYGIPSHVSGLRPENVIRATKNDKKMEAGVIKFILLDGIGHAFIDRTVSEEEMKEALSVIL